MSHTVEMLRAAHWATLGRTIVTFPPGFADPQGVVIAGHDHDAIVTLATTGPTVAWSRGVACALPPWSTAGAYTTALIVAGALARSGRRSWGKYGRVVTIAHTVAGWEVRTLSRGHYDAHKTGRVVAIVAC